MEITLPTLIDLFVTTKQTEARSARTLRCYRTSLEHFATYLDHGSPQKLSELTVDQARAFVGSLQSRNVRYQDHPNRPEVSGGLSPYTVHGYVRTLRAFSRWLYEEGFTSKDIFARLQRPKLPQTVIEILSDQEIDAIMSAMNPATLLGSRLQVIVLLLLDTGVRASELYTLKVEHVFLEEEYIKVLGKGNKERIVPFGSTTKKALLRYMHTFRPEPANDGVTELILSADGFALSYRALSHAIERLGRRAKVPRLHLHLLRTFAVRYLMNGGDIMTLKRMLGHESLEVTQIYMHLAEAHIQIQHRRFSPVDRLNLNVGKGRAASRANR